MMIQANLLRNKEILLQIPNDRPGYYKWWAARQDFEKIASKLQADSASLWPYIEKKEDLYCIYVGIAAKESIRSRLNWHVNDPHTLGRVKSGTLSTLRQSISSIIAGNQLAKKETNDFIDRLTIEYFIIDRAISSKDSQEASEELNKIERKLMSDKLYILNIKDNKHEKSIRLIYELKKVRKESKAKAIQ
ncbi:MAG: hypothetical protein MJ202_01590 [Lentisphaeria bacterium]|nr:hypothetical protein [Lentisphaeria bacterium]